MYEVLTKTAVFLYQ